MLGNLFINMKCKRSFSATNTPEGTGAGGVDGPPNGTITGGFGGCENHLPEAESQNADLHD